jgi:hypothetical protein
MTEFVEFPKMARLRRDCVITEKIDGTNACIRITEDGQFLTGSRTRWITPQDDNYGFAKWAEANRDQLMGLGVGLHFGEWWGSGCQRGYGLKNGEKRFSLFNTSRWCLHTEEPKRIPTGDPRIEKYQERLPECCHLVPVLHQGVFDTKSVELCLDELRQRGSKASSGFMNPEGVVVFHVAGGFGFKVTLDSDGVPKSVARNSAV